MSDPACTLTLSSPEETAATARRVAVLLRPGDCLLLEGSVGAGKSHFARTVIQNLLDVPEDVPSPTFTLVQTYDTVSGEVWHCDLYRLTTPDEVFELGLEEALSDAICLIEWPDRLGGFTPKQALTLSFSMSSQPLERRLEVYGDHDRWHKVLEALCDRA